MTDNRKERYAPNDVDVHFVFNRIILRLEDIEHRLEKMEAILIKTKTTME